MNVYSKGYEPRDFKSEPFGSIVPEAKIAQIPKKDWRELYEFGMKAESFAIHAHKRNKVKILNQGSLPYCWMFGTVCAVMTRYAIQGIDPVPYLSATAPAAQGKKFRKRGGWAAEAVRYINEFGIPTVDKWPERSLDRRLVKSSEVKKSADRHKVTQFQELPSEDFEIAMSALLQGHVVTLGLSWWKHLVCGLAPIYENGQWGILFANSWGESWGDKGFGKLFGRKAIAHEYFLVEHVSPRSE
jgi:hypothetical protein